MISQRHGFFVLALAALGSAHSHASKSPTPQTKHVDLGAHAESWSYGSFGTVVLYAPDGPPKSVALYVSGDGGWNLGVVSMAETLRQQGALVVGIDIRAFLKSLDSGSGECHYAAGDLEALSRAVQLKKGLPEYLRPILVGYSSGATLVYGALESAPPETFAGALSLGFCPDLETVKAPCKGRGPAPERRTKPPKGWDLTASSDLGVPWIVLEGQVDQVCDPPATRRFVESVPSAKLVSLPKVGHGFSVTRNWEPQFIASYRELVDSSVAAKEPRPADAAVADLPLVEVQAKGDAQRDLFAVIASGDGGWAGLDKAIAARLATSGVPVVGWSSLQYYWKPRTPDEAARDLARIVTHYAASWKKSKVLLIGYSFGADVLPYLANRLPAEAASRVVATALIGLSSSASFEFHVSEWLGGGSSKFPTAPEVGRMKAPALCLYGEKEDDSPCPSLPVRSKRLSGGHHYGGDYATLAATILEFATSGT